MREEHVVGGDDRDQLKKRAAKRGKSRMPKPIRIYLYFIALGVGWPLENFGG